MKVLFDHQIFSRQKYGGISRYFCEIIDHLQCEKGVALKYSDNIYLRQKKIVPSVENLFDPRQDFLRGIEFKGKGRLFKLFKNLCPKKYLDAETQNKNHTIEYLKKQDFDVFHPTYYDDYFLKYIGNKPFILTIHDMNHELFPEFYSSPEELDFVKTKADLAREASHIIAVSENTKKDIIEILGINEDKISVIYHAVSSNAGEEKEIVVLPERYLLYVGDRAAEYKNFKFMARAVAPLLRENKNLFVVCTGRDFDYRETNFFRHLGLQERFISKFVPDNMLFDIYTRAISLVFPSYSEGFGIPIIEAFHCSCPVVLAETRCFKEIAGDAALYFDLKSMTSLRESICKILNDDSVSSRLIHMGLQRVKNFSWETSAQQTLAVYNSAIQ